MRTYSDKYFETLDRPVRVRLCSHPACGQAGHYRAPKSRDELNAYYYFCLDHVREYNKAWDFFSGLKPEEIEAYTRNATVWERPSWPVGQWGSAEKNLHQKAMHDIFGESADPAPETDMATACLPLAERDALAELELSFPVDFATVKGKYRALVKKHHPDVQRGDRKNEEKFKSISQAFATLQKFFKKEGKQED